MADELITCSTCGTKNASHRTVCLSCGGELLALKDRSEIPTRSLMKRAAPVVKRINTPGGWSAGALLVVGAYFGLTWFFFGSSHPCGILEARERSYVVNRYYEDAIARIEFFSSFKNAAAGKLIDEIYKELADAPKRAAHDLHERIWDHYTPAQCLWGALAWNPDPYKGSSPLKDILKARE